MRMFQNFADIGSLLTLAFVLATRRLTGFAGEAQPPLGRAAVEIASATHFRPCLPTYYPVLKAGQHGTYPSLVFPVLLLPLPFPFRNDGQKATVKLVNLIKHSVYFGLDDQPAFIGEIDHSLLVPPFGAPGPEPDKSRDRTQRGDRQKQCPSQQKPLHFLRPVVNLAALLTQL
jgi:hypothetical protein